MPTVYEIVLSLAAVIATLALVLLALHLDDEDMDEIGVDLDYQRGKNKSLENLTKDLTTPDDRV